MKSGKTQQKDFFITIPFKFRAGLPILEVKVNGLKANFLFDTGAPNVISLEFAEKLRLKTKAKGSVEDSGGNKVTGQKYVSLSNVKIGSVNFLNTGAIIQNLNSSDIMKCIKLDGIIGANLMKKAFWKIDYENQTLTLTDNISKLEITDDYKSLKFKAKISGTPLVSLSINGNEIKNITFDTGSNGQITLPKKIYHKLKKKGLLKSTFIKGSTSYGVIGKSQSDTTYFAKSKNFRIGDISLNNKILKFRKHSDIIGTGFLKNFDIILDWKNSIIYLKKNKDYDYSSIKDFGFKPDLRDNKLFVGAIFNKSDSNGKLEIGDEILEINKTNFGNLSKFDFCELVNNRKWKYEKSENIKIKIKRNKEVLIYEIKKLELLK
jgi:predicted aspartyl protease